MDNLAHMLAGAALGEAGLKRKTGLGMATLMIAANLPDIDALGLIVGENLAWRRGWTHGPIALVILPLLLACAMILFDRWQARRGTRPPGRAPVQPGWLLLLAYIGVASHPLLDFLNTYGIRCLMPFSDRWFYGDALFIVDLWMWGALALGVGLSRRRQRLCKPQPGRPAIVGLVAVAAYAGAMGSASLAAQNFVAREMIAAGKAAPARVVASPVPINPFRRDFVYDTGSAYGFGTLRWTPRPEATFLPGLTPTNMADPAVASAARQDKAVADFLYWSRLPFATIARDAGQAEVVIGDARYGRSPGKGPFSVRATVPDPAAPPRPAPGQAPGRQAPASGRE